MNQRVTTKWMSCLSVAMPPTLPLHAPPTHPPTLPLPLPLPPARKPSVTHGLAVLLTPTQLYVMSPQPKEPLPVQIYLVYKRLHSTLPNTQLAAAEEVTGGAAPTVLHDHPAQQQQPHRPHTPAGKHCHACSKIAAVSRLLLPASADVRRSHSRLIQQGASSARQH